MATLRQLVNDLIDQGLAALPTPVIEHLTNAKKELLLAMRALLDEELKWSDRHLARAREIKARRAQERGDRDRARRMRR
jgi:hypothetical protein